MNRNRYESKTFSHVYRVFIMALVMVFLISSFSGSVLAEIVEPIDKCIGVDHPPFEQEYAGDGNSYLRVGLTFAFEYFDEGETLTGELTGNGNTMVSTDMLNADGQVFFTFPLYSYGSYEVMIYDDMGGLVYQENVSVDETEPVCDLESLSKAPRIETTETDTTETDTTEIDTTETDVNNVTEEETSTDSANENVTTEKVDGFPSWPIIIIGGGLLLVIFGVMKFLKKNCEKERKAWLAASDQAKAASDKAREAEERAENLGEEREVLEEELSDIRDVYPSAGKKGGDEAWVEMDGRRITSRDVAMKKEAQKAAWDDYKEDPNSESAQDLQDDWHDIGKPESEEERRELDKDARNLEEAIKNAKKAEDNAKKIAKDAKKNEEDAEKKAEIARLAYEACIKKALTPVKPAPKPETKPASTSGSKPTSTSGSKPGTISGPKPGSISGPTLGSSTTPEEGVKKVCQESDPPQERNRKNLGRVSIPVRLEVTLQGGGAHDGAVAANDISDQLADASEKLGWISKAMDLKGIGQTLVRDGAGWSLVDAAAAPTAGAALDMPVPTSPGQLAVDTLSILGKISSVIIKKVPELQERRLPDCDLQATMKNNVYTAECVEIWVCSNGNWVKDRTKFTLKLIARSSGRMTKRRGITWAKAQGMIRRYEHIYSNRLKVALDRLSKLESGCK